MRFNGVFIALCLKILYVENVMLPLHYPLPKQESVTFVYKSEEDQRDQYGIIRLRDPPESSFEYDHNKRFYIHSLASAPGNSNPSTKPCSVVVLSNGQNTALQTLLRKYRYDANGFLIPSSVKYFIKMSENLGSEPILVPLTGKAFSPLGGFVRYYKEVPPIPPSL